ncbi:MAG TPA: hypothetical protein VNQ52_00585 [Microbacteriaceae bacterium]|nr:hypothetical protein [Microbacteriaceae bacterium]
MTTQVQERMPAPALPAVRRRSARGSWLVLLVATILAAFLIGVIAALLGNAMKAVTDASGLLGSAQSAYQTAQVDTAAAVDAERTALAALEAKRQEAIAQLEAQGTGTSFSINATLPIVAEVRAMETSIAQNETAAVQEALATEESARADIEAANGQLIEAQQSVDAIATPFWIATIVSGIVLLLLAAVAILRTRAIRRR